MRYLLLILLLAGGYYGWDYYQNGLAPRHEALKAMEQEPCPELDAAQARFDEAAELHEQQAARLQKAIQRKEEAVRKYWDARIKQAGQEKDGRVSLRKRARSKSAGKYACWWMLPESPERNGMLRTLTEPSPFL